MEKRKYANDFKRMIVELSNTGKTAKELGTAYGINSGIIRRWKREYKAKQGDLNFLHLNFLHLTGHKVRGLNL